MRDFASFVDWALIVAPNLAEDEEQASRAGGRHFRALRCGDAEGSG